MTIDDDLRTLLRARADRARATGLLQAVDAIVRTTPQPRPLVPATPRPSRGDLLRVAALAAALVLVVGGLALAVAIQLVFVGGEFMPRQDEGLARVTLKLPPGTPIARTTAIAARAESLLTAVPEGKALLTQVGGGGSGFRITGAGVNVAGVQVTADSDQGTEAV